MYLLESNKKQKDPKRRAGKRTHNDVLPGLEGADVVGVVRVIHLLQDRRHAGQIVILKDKGSALR